MDVRRVYAPYEADTRGAPPCAPKMMGCLLRSASGVGGCARRQIAQACARHLACRAMVGQDRPDFRPLSDCRPRPLAACCAVCVPGRRLAGEAGLGTLGPVATEGTTRPGNASRHTARRSGDRKKAVERLREDSEALGTQASQHDAEDDAAVGSRRGDELPAEWARRADRLATLAAAMQRLEARATAEAAAARQRRTAAEAERQRTGKTRRGRGPTAVAERPADNAPRRCTAPAWPSMQTHKTGWDDGGQAPARVDGASQSIVAGDGTAAANDTPHAVPMAQLTVAPVEPAGLARPQDATGAAQPSPATSDRGSSRAAAGEAVEPVGCAPSRATGRQRHAAPESEVRNPPTTATERLAATVRPSQGRAVSARRQVLVEPVVGQRKAARGFRRFVLRGVANRRAAWCLGCVTHHLRKLWRDTCAPITVSADERVSDVPKMVLCRATISSEPTVLRRDGHDFGGKCTRCAGTLSRTDDQ